MAGMSARDPFIGVRYRRCGDRPDRLDNLYGDSSVAGDAFRLHGDPPCPEKVAHGTVESGLGLRGGAWERIWAKTPLQFCAEVVTKCVGGEGTPYSEDDFL